MTGWNPDAYMKFGNERTRPSIDLVGRIALADPASIVDIGCGPGKWHLLLQDFFDIFVIPFHISLIRRNP